MTLRQAQLTDARVGRRLDWEEADVRRLLDPRRTSNLSKLECALGALGRHLIVGFEAVA